MLPETLKTFKLLVLQKAQQEGGPSLISALPPQCIDCAGIDTWLESLCVKYSIKRVKLDFNASLSLIQAFEPPPGNLHLYCFNDKGEVSQLYGSITGSRLGLYNSVLSTLNRGKTFSEKLLSLYYTLRDTFVNWRRGEKILAGSALEEERLSICLTCPKYNVSQKRCEDCGCFIHAKVKLQASNCPLNKW